MSTSKYNCLAKALYENVGEAPDELSFKRGDVLTVLEQNTDGLEGWWLCSLHGKQGIAPGNRLKLLVGIYDTGRGLVGEGHYQTLPRQPKSIDIENTPTKWNRRSWDTMPDKIMKPIKVGSVFVYDQPNQSASDYDVPPKRYFPPGSLIIPEKDTQGNYDTLPSSKRQSYENAKNQRLTGDDSVYDTPPSSLRNSSHNNSINTSHDMSVYDTPPSHSNSLINESNYQVPQSSQSNRSSVVSMLSTGSTAMSSGSSSGGGYQQSNPPSVCGSTRSSGDISMDIYDIPPSSVKKCSSESLLEIYDTPPLPKPTGDNNTETLKAIKQKVIHDDSENNERTLTKSYPKYDPRFADYDVPTSKPVLLGSKEAVDDNEYDVPPPVKNEVFVESNQPILPKKSKNDSHIYDYPPQVSRDSAISGMSNTSSDSLDEKLNNLSLNGSSFSSRNSDTVSNALAVAQGVLGSLPVESVSMPIAEQEGLDVDDETALAELAKREIEVHSSASKLLSYPQNGWRLPENISSRVNDVKLACMFVKTTTHDYLTFCQRSLVNASSTPDKNLVQRFQSELDPLEKSQQMIVRSMKCLKEAKWDISMLQEPTHSSEDYLGDIVINTKPISDIVRKLSILIRGNSLLLFPKKRISQRPLPSPPGGSPKRTQSFGQKPPVKPKPKLAAVKSDSPMSKRPLPSPPAAINRPLPSPPGVSDLQLTPEKLSTSDASHIVEDYDYVQLESTPEISPLPNAVHSDFTPKQKAQLEVLEKEIKKDIQSDLKYIETTAGNISSGTPTAALSPNDKQVLLFYCNQVVTHSELLTNAIDAFLGGIEYNQPPKVFVAHSKIVVLAAHKLIYISDTLNRNINSADVCNKVAQCANTLCDHLKQCVVSTKTAALQYPSVNAMQAMVDQVVDISHSAHQLGQVIAQAAKL